MALVVPFSLFFLALMPKLEIHPPIHMNKMFLSMAVSLNEERKEQKLN